MTEEDPRIHTMFALAIDPEEEGGKVRFYTDIIQKENNISLSFGEYAANARLFEKKVAENLLEQLKKILVHTSEGRRCRLCPLRDLVVKSNDKDGSSKYIIKEKA